MFQDKMINTNIFIMFGAGVWLGAEVGVLSSLIVYHLWREN